MRSSIVSTSLLALGSLVMTASPPPSSRIAGFYQLDVDSRRALMQQHLGLTSDEVDSLLPGRGLSLHVADKMVENCVGVLAMPVGLGWGSTLSSMAWTASSPWPWKSPASLPR